jgi:hypothetical protein
MYVSTRNFPCTCVKFVLVPVWRITESLIPFACVFAGEMPVPEEHYGKGVPVVLNLYLRLVEFSGDLLGYFCYFIYHHFFVPTSED